MDIREWWMMNDGMMKMNDGLRRLSAGTKTKRRCHRPIRHAWRIQKRAAAWDAKKRKGAGNSIALKQTHGKRIGNRRCERIIEMLWKQKRNNKRAYLQWVMNYCFEYVLKNIFCACVNRKKNSNFASRFASRSASRSVIGLQRSILC